LKCCKNAIFLNTKSIVGNEPDYSGDFVDESGKGIKYYSNPAKKHEIFCLFLLKDPEPSGKPLT
jgi:hypothetical protein